MDNGKEHDTFREAAAPSLVPSEGDRSVPLGVGRVTSLTSAGSADMERPAWMPLSASDLLEFAPDAIVLSDADGAIALVNRQAELLFGYARSDLIGQSVELLLPDHLRSMHRQGRAHYVAEPTSRAMGSGRTYHGRRCDGTLIPVEISLSPFATAQGTFVMSMIRDVSARMRLEAGAPERMSQLAATFEAMSDAVGLYGEDGRIIAMNAAARSMLGLQEPLSRYTAQELGARMALRREDGRALPPEDWPLARALSGQTLTGPQAMDVVFRALDGREWHTSTTAAPVRDTEGNTIGAVLIVRDVTERRRLEHEVAAKAREVEAIFGAMADGLAVYDATGHIIRCNDAFAALLGFDTPEQLSALSLEERARLIPPSDARGEPIGREAWPLARALHGEVLTGAHAVQIVMRRRDGSEITASISLAPLRDSGGQVTGAVAVVRDVTARQRQEQERLDTLRGVAHDLGNPLAAVTLAAQRMRRQIERTGAPLAVGEPMLAPIEYALSRINRLLEDLRVAAGEGAAGEAGMLELRLERFDLVGLCEREVAAQRDRTGREVHFTVSPEPLPHSEATPGSGEAAVVDVEADRERIGRVLANLLSNALKYSPAGQPVTVELRREGDRAHVCVRDEGPGIPPGEQAHIWERFHRVPGIRAQDGSSSLGLGLFICKAIVERHGGQIGVESAVGRGSTFWFTLPLAAPARSL